MIEDVERRRNIICDLYAEAEEHRYERPAYPDAMLWRPSDQFVVCSQPECLQTTVVDGVERRVYLGADIYPRCRTSWLA